MNQYIHEQVKKYSCTTLRYNIIYTIYLLLLFKNKTKYADHKNLNLSGPPHFVQEVINIKLFFNNSEYFRRL